MTLNPHPTALTQIPQVPSTPVRNAKRAMSSSSSSKAKGRSGSGSGSGSASGGKQPTLFGFFKPSNKKEGAAAPPAPAAVSAAALAAPAPAPKIPPARSVTASNSQLDTPPPTDKRSKAHSSDDMANEEERGSSPPPSSPTTGRMQAQAQAQARAGAPNMATASSRLQKQTAKALTPPASSPMQIEEEEDEDEEMPVRRRSATKRPVKYAESEDEDAAEASEDEGFAPSSSKRRGTLSRKPNKRLRAARDEDDFIVADDEPLSDAPSVMDVDEDGEESDEPLAQPKRSKANAKAKPSPSRASPLNSFKVGSALSSSSSTPTRPPPTMHKSSSSNHLTKAERRVQEEKLKKATNEAAFSFLVDLKDKDGNRPGSPGYDPRTVYIPKSAWQEFTPFEKQFWEIKQDHWDTVLFFQKGKFYELYEEDALIGHREFDLKLTDRVKMKMVGVPEASFDLFAAKFLALGYKVGRVDQCETAVAKGMRTGDKKPGGGSEIVRRELRHVLTSGTIVDADSLPDDLNNYCISIKEYLPTDSSPPSFGVCTLDAATAEFNLTAFDDDVSRTKLETLLRSLRLKELIHEKGNLSQQTLRVLRNTVPHSCQWTVLKPSTEFLDEESTLRKLNVLFNPELADEDLRSVDPVDAELLPEAIASMLEKPQAMSALGGLLWYLSQLNLDKDLCSSRNFNIFDPIRQNQCLILDAQSLTHLNVLSNEHGSDEGTLHRLLNRCVTPFGKRLFKIWLIAPLTSVRAINDRLDAVDDLMKNSNFEDDFDSFARSLPDLERLIPRIYAGRCKPKDFIKVLKGFGKFQESIEHLLDCTEGFESKVVPNLLRSIPEVQSKVERLQEMFITESDGSFMPRQGVNEAFDEAEEEIARIETELEAELPAYRKNLGLRQNDVGWKHIGTKEIYQIEVPAKTKVPSNWTLMSSTKDKKRYYSLVVRDLVQELKEARETRLARLKEFHSQLFDEFKVDGPTYLAAVKGLAEVDCLLSLAKASYAMGEPACRPEFVESDQAMLDFESLRHPCISSVASDFIPNDIKLGGEEDEVIVLTGGNMAGKSTTARTSATAVIIAQLGCRVPANRARLAPVDRIASRMGANDQIFRNNSTFMVEMLEASRIINECTPRSLVVMDELGRGTSTFDGQAIAFAVLHHLIGRTRCLAFFLTHYTSLAYDFDAYPRVSNKHMQVLVDDDKREVVFTYRLVPGIAESSYGTQVAALAGVPTEICDRASSVSREFLASSKEIQAQRSQSRIPMASLSDFAYLFKLGAGAQGGALPDDEEDAKTICSQLDVIRAQVKALAGAGAENAPVAEAVDVAVAVDVGTTASSSPGMPAKAFYGKRARSQRDAPSAGTSANTDTDTMSTPSTPQKANKGQMPTAMHDGVVPRSFSSPISSHSSLMPKLKAGGGGGGCSRANRRVLKPTTSARQEQEQLVLDFGQRIRVTCAACGMSYDRSAPEDMALHQKHHERMTKGVEWTAKALHVAGEEVGRMTLSAATVAKIGGGMGRGGGNKANKDNLGLGLDANVVRILQYSLDTQGGASPSSDAVVMRKLNEVMGSMDEALGAAPLSDKIRRACKVFVAVRAGRVMGAAVVGRVEKGAARRVVSPRDGGGGKGAMIADEDAQGEESSMRVYDAGDAIFVSDPLPSSSTPPIGIHRIHVLPGLRRCGLAHALLDAVLERSVYGMDGKAVERAFGGRVGAVAFSQPTEAGRKLAESWMRKGASASASASAVAASASTSTGQQRGEKGLIVFED